MQDKKDRSISTSLHFFIRVKRILCLAFIKVAQYSFPGPILPKFEHKLRRHKQSCEKIATTVVLNEDENLL